MTEAIATERVIGLGDNNPPSPIDGFETHVEDLLVEARNYLDGSGVNSDAEAEGVSRLMDHLRRARKDADAERAREKKPHDDAGKAIQTKWKPLLDKADLAIKTASAALTPYLAKKEAARIAREEAARKEAEEAERRAREAQAAARADDMASLLTADVRIEAAENARKAAERIAREKTHATGGERVIGLRTYRRAEITDTMAFTAWVNLRRTMELNELLTGLANNLIRAGISNIPGVNIIEERKAQ